jgi:D-aminoacyl-tRNA deacylase
MHKHIAIIGTDNDPASANIMQCLREIGAKGLHAITEDLITCEDLDKRIDADLFIFASRHESASKMPCLTVHAPGNWAEAKHGGKSGFLCHAPSVLIIKALLILQDKVKASSHLTAKGYQAMQECTHHGPYMEKPCMFIEIGSSPAEWQDKEAGRAVAETIIEAMEAYHAYQKQVPEPVKQAIGIGGLHYAPKFNKLAIEEGIAFGHICPKYALPALDEAMIQQAIEKSSAKLVYVDWKGLGQEKERIGKALDRIGIKYLKI